MSAGDNNNLNSSVSRRKTLLQIPFIATAAIALSQTPPALAEPMKTYLTEPTEEFKESERQRMEFRRAQLALKQEMLTILERLTTKSQTEDELRTDLEELRAVVVKTGGMPLGIKKDDLVKMVRSKKAKGYWPTSVEIAYQAVIREIAYQQSPNTDKELGNPMDQGR